ncbi:MAG: tRNA 2'-O-methylase [Methanomassiliicoccales archaeon PtaB.Bin215]|nr:MAG: tRNA 2'-O-methylase [Methanomassiliicoccales archaeon PtaB.Bin215]
MSSYPSTDDCYRIMREEGLSLAVIRHCCVVNLVAMAIARRCGADLELVNAASLLHDIGRSATHGVNHVAESVLIARKRGLPEELVNCIGRHIASGFTAEEAEALGLPRGDYMPVSLEDKVVNFADNLVSDRSIKTVAQAAERMRSKGFELTATRMLAMGEDIARLCGQDIDSLLERAKVREAVAGCDRLA